MQFVIDLISRASQSRHTHSMSYSDAVNYILQVIVDVIVYGERVSVYGVCVSVCVCECVCMVCVCMVSVCECVCVCVCVWWVCVRVSVLDSKAFFKFVIVAIFFLMQNQSLISLLNFFNWFKSFSISTIPVTHHQNFKKNCSLTCLILYNRCQMLTCWLYQLYQQVCVCVCVYGIPVLQMGALVVLLVESWAHNPEDTGSDPRAGV